MENKVAMNKPRMVNVELLRIIAMLLVLIGHWNIACNGDVTYESTHDHLLKAIAVSWGKSWTFVCVPCFIIISGYFGIRWKWKGLANYLFQLAFWSVLVYGITALLGLHDYSAMGFVMRPLTCIMGNWFFMAYLGLYVFAPIINAFVEKSTEKELGWMVLAFFALQTVFGWILKSMHEFDMGMTATSLMGYYLLGAYMRCTTLKIFRMGGAFNIGMFLGIGLLCTILNVATQYVGFSKDVYSYISPMQVLQTAFMFLFCKSLVIKSMWMTKVITFFASSAFAGLLMHSWEGGSLYGPVHNWIYEKLSMPALWSLGFILVFFMVACCLDKSRLFVWNAIARKWFK